MTLVICLSSLAVGAVVFAHFMVDHGDDCHRDIGDGNAKKEKQRIEKYFFHLSSFQNSLISGKRFLPRVCGVQWIKELSSHFFQEFGT